MASTLRTFKSLNVLCSYIRHIIEYNGIITTIINWFIIKQYLFVHHYQHSDTITIKPKTHSLSVHSTPIASKHCTSNSDCDSHSNINLFKHKSHTQSLPS
eukprot:368559_1